VAHAVPVDAVRPWRTAALVASGVAVVELAGLIVVGALLIARPLATHRAKGTPRLTAQNERRHSKPRPARAEILPRARTRVVVLNANGVTGAAASQAATVRARGYKISAVGNAPRPTQGHSLVMYRPGFAAEARRLAHDAGIGVVTALDGLTTSSLHRAQLVIVVGR
jgi:hypothetical protein